MCWPCLLVARDSGGPGGKSALEQAIQEELPPSHADAGEPDEDGERRAGGNAGPPPGAEERPAPLAAEGGGAQSHDGEVGSGAQVNQSAPATAFRSPTERHAKRKKPSWFYGRRKETGAAVSVLKLFSACVLASRDLKKKKTLTNDHKKALSSFYSPFFFVLLLLLSHFKGLQLTCFNFQHLLLCCSLKQYEDDYTNTAAYTTRGNTTGKSFHTRLNYTHRITHFVRFILRSVFRAADTIRKISVWLMTRMKSSVCSCGNPPPRYRFTKTLTVMNLTPCLIMACKLYFCNVNL